MRARCSSGLGGDLGVGDGDAVEVARRARPGVAERRVEPDADPVRGVRPLPLEVLGRGDDGDRADVAALEQLGGDPQRERGLAGAGRRDREEVARASSGGTRRAPPAARRAAWTRSPRARAPGKAGGRCAATARWRVARVPAGLPTPPAPEPRPPLTGSRRNDARGDVPGGDARPAAGGVLGRSPAAPAARQRREQPDDAHDEPDTPKEAPRERRGVQGREQAPASPMPSRCRAGRRPEAGELRPSSPGGDSRRSARSCSTCRGPCRRRDDHASGTSQAGSDPSGVPRGGRPRRRARAEREDRRPLQPYPPAARIHEPVVQPSDPTVSALPASAGVTPRWSTSMSGMKASAPRRSR